MASKKTEDAIRTYLNSLGRPDRPVVDREAVNALKQQIKAESDPIEKAKLISARDREMLGHMPDRSAEQAAFVEAALAWSEEAGVTGDALAEMGVPVSVLRQAGFDPVAVSPRQVYADAGRPETVEGFTRRTFIAMVEGVREPALAAGLIDARRWEEGIEDLRRTAGPGGTFAYTFFKAVGRNPGPGGGEP